MRIDLSATSATSGGGGSVALVGEFLVTAMPDVGSLVRVVEVELLVRSSPEAPRGSRGGAIEHDELDALLAALGPDFGLGPGHPDWSRERDARRARGGSLRLRRGAGKIVATIVSDLSEHDTYAAPIPTPEQFATAARETVAALVQLRSRIKTDDDLDVGAFLAHLDSRLAVLPRTVEDLTTVLAELDERSRRRWAALDGWDLLDIDWEQFTPDVRERFADPFFFDPADADAPFGNDAGAEILAAYVAAGAKDARRFLARQCGSFGHDSLARWREDDLIEHDQVVVAAAFAELMVRGSLGRTLRREAREALDRRDPGVTDPRTQLLKNALDRA